MRQSTADAALRDQPARSRSLLAFLYAVPIAILGGLIGLGGAEFRLPVLAGPLGYSVRQAVPLNLSVSIITIIASLAIRSRSLTLAPVAPYTPAILALIAGAVAAALAGTALFGHLSDARLERTILVLLLVIGIALIVEGVLPQTERALLPNTVAAWIAAGVFFGLGIGLVSSLLGVAGGEVIIPTLVFAYGADIKTAGTASLLISLPTVAVGIALRAAWKLQADDAGRDRRADGVGLGDRRHHWRALGWGRAVRCAQGRARRHPHRLGLAHLSPHETAWLVVRPRLTKQARGVGHDHDGAPPLRSAARVSSRKPSTLS
jgi:uncharacterized membrane protein YfcA